MTAQIQPGAPCPIGATPGPGGVNFSVFADKADAVELLFFDRVDGSPTRVIRLDPHRPAGRSHRTYHYWHVLVPDARAGQIYAYRAVGPNAPARGLCYDAEKVLLDPYGRAVAVPASYSREAACQPGDNAATAMKSVVVDPSRYDREGDQPLRRPIPQTVIYEMHVAGFTRDPSSGVTPEKRGTYAGLVEKIRYLQDLGITSVELLPVYQFDPSTAPSGLVNYWGYQPVAFFAPHTAYSSRQDPLGVLDEFRDMVKALHRAGIEVILDVVYNRTAEAFGWAPGGAYATLSFRGLANDVYYILDEADKSRYADFTGCGNTLNAGNAVVGRRLTSIFLKDAQGRRPVQGGARKFQEDPYWRDCPLFYEYFHGDNGAGVGASHQTGWSGAVARIMHLLANSDPQKMLEQSKGESAGAVGDRATQ